MAAVQPEQPGQPAHQSDKRLANHLQVRKTQARPVRTLFGSVLERLSEDELRRLPDCDAAEARGVYNEYWRPRIRERPAPTSLPPELAAFVRDRHAPDIERQSREIDEWRQRLQVRERRINLMERDAKYVFELPHPVESLPDARDYGPRPRWMTAGDLSHASEVNPNFLAPGVRNFNRDKYRRLPESHNYALAGDPLRPGMDFDQPPVEMQRPPLLPLNARPDRLVLTPRTEQRQQALRRLPPSSQVINGIEVPMRLKHQFGSEVCESLLGNRDAVLETSRRIQQLDKASSRQAAVVGAGEPAAGGEQRMEVGNATYEQLGNALRTNMFGRGYSLNQRVSSNHVDFSRAQFDKREPVPDAHRYQKDHVSRWAEANVLEMRMKKALQERMDRMLHKKKAEE